MFLYEVKILEQNLKINITNMNTFATRFDISFRTVSSIWAPVKDSIKSSCSSIKTSSKKIGNHGKKAKDMAVLKAESKTINLTVQEHPTVL